MAKTLCLPSSRRRNSTGLSWRAHTCGWWGPPLRELPTFSPPAVLRHAQVQTTIGNLPPMQWFARRRPAARDTALSGDRAARRGRSDDSSARPGAPGTVFASDRRAHASRWALRIRRANQGAELCRSLRRRAVRSASAGNPDGPRGFDRVSLNERPLSDQTRSRSQSLAWSCSG